MEAETRPGGRDLLRRRRKRLRVLGTVKLESEVGPPSAPFQVDALLNQQARRLLRTQYLQLMRISIASHHL